jgi:hypothetical protein
MVDGKEESINSVRFLKTNSGKKGEGMPVVRNPQFYFRERYQLTSRLTPFKKKLTYMLRSYIIFEEGGIVLE